MAAGSSSSGAGFFDGDSYQIPPITTSHPPPSATGGGTGTGAGGGDVSAASNTGATAGPASSQNPKKRRNVQGTANPDAEVIALSPKSLMATNRFICEVCNKGFQREQNLQLHRRGHNLPWKLKQKSSNKDVPVRKKVYLCPEPSCVHHEPSRALGDLTGIKKHFYRKHGEKKFKCDKCSKRYAVQSDWKAHRKTCGTREYRCDCGTVFSRRDSFVTHRAFCDVITREALNHPTNLAALGGGGGGSFFAPSTAGAMGLGLPQLHHHSIQSSSSSMQNQLLDHHQQQHHQNPNDLMLHDGPRSKFDHLLPSAFHPMMTSSTSTGGGGGGYGIPSSTTQQNGYGHGHGHHGHGTTLENNDNNNNNNHLLDHPQQQQGPDDTDSPASGNGLFNIGFFSQNNSTNLMPTTNFPHHHVINTNGNEADETGATNLFSMGNNMLGGGQITSGFTSLFAPSGNLHQLNPHMSATALLQKAAQIGSTSSNNNNHNHHPNPPFHIKSGAFGSSTSSSHPTTTTNKPTTDPKTSASAAEPSILPLPYDGSSLFDQTDHTTNNIQEFINTLNGGTSSSSIRFGMPGMGSDRLTRDFLGVGRDQPPQQHGIDFMINNLNNNNNNNNNNNGINNAGHHQNYGGRNDQ